MSADDRLALGIHVLASSTASGNLSRSAREVLDALMRRRRMTPRESEEERRQRDLTRERDEMSAQASGAGEAESEGALTMGGVADTGDWIDTDGRVDLECRTTFPHQQLRDLVHADPDSADLFYTSQFSIKRVNTEDGVSRVVRQLDFRPTTMAVNDGYLAAGGQAAQLFVRDLNEGSIVYEGEVGSAITNGLHISTVEGDTRVLVCNNDCKMKVFSLPTLERVDTCTFPVPPNCATASPDGRFVASAGDSDLVTLFDVQGSMYTSRSVLSGGGGHGFSIAWSPDSLSFAVASQNGVVCVWDVRMERVLAKIRSTQRGSRGAARCVKYAKAPFDLLVFNEHSNAATVVDARTYNECQVLKLTESGPSQSLSGVCFAPDCSRIFFGLESSIAAFPVQPHTRLGFAAGSLL